MRKFVWTYLTWASIHPLFMLHLGNRCANLITNISRQSFLIRRRLNVAPGGKGIKYVFITATTLPTFVRLALKEEKRGYIYISFLNPDDQNF